MDSIVTTWMSPASDWPAWATAGATLLLVVVAGVALRSLGDAKRTRHAQLIVSLSQRWIDPPILESIEEWGLHKNAEILDLIEKVYIKQKATSDETKALRKLIRIPELMETIGVLVNEEALDADVAFDMWGDTIIAGWEAWKDAVATLRASQHNRPWTFEFFESLADEMRWREEERWANAAWDAGEAFHP